MWLEIVPPHSAPVGDAMTKSAIDADLNSSLFIIIADIIRVFEAAPVYITRSVDLGLW